jgi:dihydropyrimidinase
MSTGDTTIDAQGRFVLPGFIDPHVHMELPFMGTVSDDDFAAGTASGIAGGTTSIIDFCIPAPGTSLLDGLATWKERAAKATSDYSFHMAITGWGENTANEMRAVVRDHGITSFKVFMAYKGAIMVDDHALYQVMKVAAETGAVVTVHAENGDVVWNLQRELVAKGPHRPRVPPGVAPRARSRARPRSGRSPSRDCTTRRRTSCT